MHTPRDDKAGGHICKFNADAAPSSLRLGFTAALHILAGPLAPALSPSPITHTMLTYISTTKTGKHQQQP